MEKTINDIIENISHEISYTLKKNLGTIVDLYNSNENIVISLKEILFLLPEYKNLIQKNEILLKENNNLKTELEKYSQP